MAATLVSAHVAATYARELREASAPDRVLAVVHPGGEVDGDLEEVDVAFLSADLYPERILPYVRALRDCPNLAWLQGFAAGVDNKLFTGLQERGVVVTTASGTSAAPIAHTVWYYLLSLSRRAHLWRENQRHHVWQPHDVDDLPGRRLVVVGLGPIGLEVARLGVAFGMDVVGVRRKPRGDEPCPVAGFDELDALLPSADALVLAVPLSPDTAGLLDRRRIGLLPDGAWVVNVGRGGLLDQEALTEALASGRLGGAGLDVFAVEPLPADDQLWDIPTVIVTPHASGQVPDYAERVARLFLANLARWTRGEPLLNVAG